MSQKVSRGGLIADKKERFEMLKHLKKISKEHDSKKTIGKQKKNRKKNKLAKKARKKNRK